MNFEGFLDLWNYKDLFDKNDVVKLAREFYLVNSDQKKLLDNFRGKFNVVWCGVYLGFEKEFFVPSLWLLQELSKKINKKVWVNSKGEWLFICNRNVLSESIAKIENVENNDLCLVINQHNECLGIGRKEKTIIKNIFDIGDFLRRERKN